MTVVPEIVFPDFPLAGDMTNNLDGTVTVPADWLIRLEEYRIKISMTEKEYEEIKKLYQQK